MSDQWHYEQKGESYIKVDTLHKIRTLESELAAVTEQLKAAQDGWHDEITKGLSELRRAESIYTKAQERAERAEEQRDRLAEALEQWQPIETAPKDRSFILSAHPEHGYLITRWLGAREMWDGWAIEPTHWMSLPKPTNTMNNTPTPKENCETCHGLGRVDAVYAHCPNCELAAAQEEIDMMGIRYAAAEMHHANNMQEVTEQRDEMARAIIRFNSGTCCLPYLVDLALQSLNQTTP